MLPTITILNKTITGYALMSIIGVFVAGIYAVIKIKKKKLDDNDMIILLLFAAIGVFIGSHLLYAIVNYKYFVEIIKNYNTISLKDTMKLLEATFGGAVFYGGLIGGIGFGLIYAKKKKLKKDYLDVAAPTIPLFHGFARIGCFLGGCCFGIESKIGFIYTHSLVPAADHVRRFPVQLVEALCDFILFFVLNKLLNKEKYKGKLIYIYLISYAIIRFILEFLRGDDYRGFVGFLSTSQLISLIVIITVIIILIINKKRSSNEKIRR